MSELYPPSLAEQIQAVRREIRMREQVYPRLVASKRMTQKNADAELAAMRAVLKTLEEVYSMADDRTILLPLTIDELFALSNLVELGGKHIGELLLEGTHIGEIQPRNMRLGLTVMRKLLALMEAHARDGEEIKPDAK